MRKIIVTGCTGQLGSYLVDYLLENTAFDIIGTVRRLSVPNHGNIAHVKNDRFSLATMDLGDVHSIENLIKEHQPAYFINCAANSFVGSSWQLPVQHMQYNAIGVMHQLEAIRKHSPHTRYFNMGSSEEFGNAQYIPQDEKHILSPKSPYGVSKCAARYVTKVYRESYDLYAIQGITFNFESKKRGLEFLTAKVVHAIGKIKNSINNNLPIEPLVVGNLESKRSWQHCLDVCDGIWRMLNQDIYNQVTKSNIANLQNLFEKRVALDGAANEDLNKALFETSVRKFLSSGVKEYVLSSDTCHSVREFIELAFERAGIDIIDVNQDRLEPTTDKNGQQVNYVLDDYNKTSLVLSSREFFRPADVTYLHGDSSLIKKELGWKPKYDFEMLVNEMVDSALTEHVK